VEQVTLPARVVEDEEGYLATIDNLKLTARGPTVKEAQDSLIEAFASWVQTAEGQGDLESILSEAGYAGVDEDTELVVEFVEERGHGRD
jgi:hypothetical protein